MYCTGTVRSPRACHAFGGGRFEGERRLFAHHDHTLLSAHEVACFARKDVKARQGAGGPSELVGRGFLVCLTQLLYLSTVLAFKVLLFSRERRDHERLLSLHERRLPKRLDSAA